MTNRALRSLAPFLLCTIWPGATFSHVRNGGTGSCATAAPFLIQALPSLVTRGDTVLDTASPVPIDIYSPGDGAVASHSPPTVRRLSAESYFWKAFYRDDERPSSFLIKSWLGAQRYSAVSCVRSYLTHRGISISPATIGRNGSKPPARGRMVIIGYPAFDQSGRNALLYVEQGESLSGEGKLLRYSLVDGTWKLLKAVRMSSS